MISKLKNRCTITLKQSGVILGTYRPTQEKFDSLQEKLEPFRILHKKVENSAYRIVLKQEEIKIGTYKVPEKVFNDLKIDIAQYRSLGLPSKKVRCIEENKVFKSAKEAARWVASIRKMSHCDMDLIKQCCRGKQKTSYGYHWEFAKENI